MSLQLSTTRLFRQPNEQLKSLFKPSNNTSLPCLASAGQYAYQSVQLLSNPHAGINLRLDHLEKYLNISSAISKHVILPRLVLDVLGLNSLMRERSSSSASTLTTINDVIDLDEYKKSESELRELMSGARQVDESLVEKNIQQVDQTLEKCFKLRQNFTKV